MKPDGTPPPNELFPIIHFFGFCIRVKLRTFFLALHLDFLRSVQSLALISTPYKDFFFHIRPQLYLRSTPPHLLFQTVVIENTLFLAPVTAAVHLSAESGDRVFPLEPFTYSHLIGLTNPPPTHREMVFTSTSSCRDQPSICFIAEKVFL